MDYAGRTVSTIAPLPYRLVAFDFDGTLADTYPWFESIWVKIAKQNGFRVPAGTEKQDLRQKDARQIMAALGVPLWKAPGLLIQLRQEMALIAHEVELFDGMPETLQALSDAGVKLALLTSNSEHNARQILGDTNAALFTHFDCGTSLFGKAAKIKRLMAAIQCEPAQTIVIGDEIRDIDAARAAGVAIGSVSWGYNDASALSARNPDWLFTTPAQLCSTLLATASNPSA